MRLDTSILSCSHAGGMGSTSFVGGVSDGTVGSVAFDFVGPFTEKLVAHKNMFFFEDFYIMSSSNISAISSTTSALVVSSIEQRRMFNTTAFSSSGIIPAGSNITLDPSTTQWIWSDNVGYLLLDIDQLNTKLHVSTMIQTGSWESIGAHVGSVSVPMFSFYLEHLSVTNASYSIAVVPNIDLKEWKSIFSDLHSEINVISNNEYENIVIFGNVCFATFYPGSSPTFNAGIGWNITVSMPGTYLFVNSGDNFTAYVGNPVQKQFNASILIDLAVQSSGNCSYSNNLASIAVSNPSNDGNTVSSSCMLI